MYMFENLDERLKASEARWEEINKLNAQLKELVKEPKCPDLEDKKIYCIGRVLTLLIDELKPMSNAREQMQNLQKEILDMFNPGATK